MVKQDRLDWAPKVKKAPHSAPPSRGLEPARTREGESSKTDLAVAATCSTENNFAGRRAASDKHPVAARMSGEDPSASLLRQRAAAGQAKALLTPRGTPALEAHVQAEVLGEEREVLGNVPRRTHRGQLHLYALAHVLPRDELSRGRPLSED